MERLTANKDLIQQFFVDERQAHRRAVIVTWIIVGLADLWGIGAYFSGVELYIILQGLIVFLALVMVCMWLSLHRKKTLQNRLSEVLASIEFGWDELHGLDLSSEESDHLHLAFASTVGRASSNETFLRTRGGDEKGPAFGKPGIDIDATAERVDPALHEEDYAGLEGELRVSEQLVEQANQHYAEEAQRLWDIAEARDMDNIEEGVSRLGDLVASGWFERNAKDGAVEELMKSKGSGDSQ